MKGMGKRYDGQFLAKTQITNINIDLGLVFRSLGCVGHLQCQNPHCNYLIGPLRSMNFDGFTYEPFSIGGPLHVSSTLMCRICKKPPMCIEPYDAKIFYLHGNDTTQRACIHLGNHRHPVKVGNCRDSRKRIDAPMEKYIERTPQTTHNNKKN